MGNKIQEISTASSRGAQIQDTPTPAALSGVVIKLTASDSHQLPVRYAGFNTPIALDVPYEDPRFQPVMRDAHTAVVRFPGGTIANYWDWRAGRFTPPPGLQGTFKTMAAKATELHPQGATLEDFTRFAKALDADTILVLNLETATPDDQVAWLKHLKEKGLAPMRVELGNEFWMQALVAGADADKIKFKDVKTTMAIWREYAEAVWPQLPQGSKIAIQTASSREVGTAKPANDPFLAGLWNWDNGLTNEPWFDAVAWHIYPELTMIMEAGRPEQYLSQVRQAVNDQFLGVAHLRSDTDADTAFHALMARIEEGTRRHAKFLADRFPGKEVWVTEYGVGENFAYYRGDYPLPTGLWVHGMARQIMALAREPNVTQILNHSVYLDGLAWSCVRRADTEEGYKPIGLYLVFAWFNEALNSRDRKTPVKVTPFAVEGSKEVAGGILNEKYRDVAALAFDQAREKTVIFHNASRGAVTLNLKEVRTKTKPTSVEALEVPDLQATYTQQIPARKALAVSDGVVTIPPMSLARLRWEGKD